MSLPISSVVKVNVSIAPTVPAKKGFGVAALVTDENTLLAAKQVERIKFYASITGVEEDWATSSETYKSALAYFSQEPKPDTFATIAKYDTQTLATLTGTIAAEADMVVWNAISDGSFKITINGVTADVTGIDTTSGAGVLNIGDVAEAIHFALIAADPAFATANVNHNGSQFIIEGAGFGGTISATSQAAIGTDISLLMATDGSIVGVDVSQGTDIETDVDALTAASQVDDSFYGVLLLKSQRDNQSALDVAAWTEARSKVFSACTNNINTLVLGSQTNIASSFQLANYSRTSCNFSRFPDEYIDAAVLGKAFTVNFNSPDSVITLKFKPLAGITTETLTLTEKSALDEKRCNALIDIGTASMYSEGFMSSQLFFDERHSIDWMVGEIESNAFSYALSRPTKIPLTDAGGASIEQQVIRALDAAVRNGMLSPGETSDGTFLANGYVTSVQKVASMAPADKANRLAPAVSFTCLLSGAVHAIQIDGVVER